MSSVYAVMGRVDCESEDIIAIFYEQEEAEELIEEIEALPKKVGCSHGNRYYDDMYVEEIEIGKVCYIDMSGSPEVVAKEIW